MGEVEHLIEEARRVPNECVASSAAHCRCRLIGRLADALATAEREIAALAEEIVAANHGCLRPYPCEHAYWSGRLRSLLDTEGTKR